MSEIIADELGKTRTTNLPSNILEPYVYTNSVSKPTVEVVVSHVRIL